MVSLSAAFVASQIIEKECRYGWLDKSGGKILDFFGLGKGEYAQRGFTDSASTRLRCKKIRIYPDLKLNKVWCQW